MKFLINCILVILVLHLLLKNLNRPTVQQQQQASVQVISVGQRGENRVEPVNIYGYNHYIGNEETPNFESNIRNIPKYYEKTNIETPYFENFQSNMNKQALVERPLNDNHYEYKNDLVMNGANIEGLDITGHQVSGNLYASVDTPNTILDSCDPYSARNKVDPDIRFGMGAPNRVIKETQ